MLSKILILLGLVAVTIALQLHPSKKSTSVVPLTPVFKTSGCLNLGSEAELKCFDQETQQALKTGGVMVGLSAMSDLYQKNPRFSAQCHAIAHLVGKAAFKQFSNHQSFDITPQTTWCDYGFYHGFIDQMVESGVDIKLAANFCRDVGVKLQSQTGSGEGKCYHGVGHGAVNLHDPTLWGNVHAILDPALERCQKISTVDSQLTSCATGVFNAIGIAYSQPPKLILDESDPFKLCREQPQNFRNTCFVNMTIPLRNKYLDDLKVASVIELIPNDSDANVAIRGLMTNSGTLQNKVIGYDRAIELCHSLQPRLRDGCVAGYAAGLMSIGELGNEYYFAEPFCKLGILTGAEKIACYKMLIYRSQDQYTKSKFEQICSGLEDPYRLLCQEGKLLQL